MTRRNGWDYVALVFDERARCAYYYPNAPDFFAKEESERGARLARYWADRVRGLNEFEERIRGVIARGGCGGCFDCSTGRVCVNPSRWPSPPDEDAYARGYADAERDVVGFLASEASQHGNPAVHAFVRYLEMAVARGDHRKERGDG